jgi:hypothetical protein
MDLIFLKRLSLLLALFGLVLIYFFSPDQQNTATSIKEVRKSCSGPVSLEGTISKIFYSSAGKLVGELKQNTSSITVFLGDSFVEEGSNISVQGKASKFSNQCWIFPERVESR